jgi:hypothetical protein
MADTNEEQLLSDLLRSIAREDAPLEAPHLELRVLTAVEASAAVRLKPVTRHIAVAAAIGVAVLTPALLWTNASVVPPTASPSVAATEEVIANKPATVVPKPAQPARTIATRRSFPTRAVRPTSPVQPTVEPAIAQSPDEFLPLMPMTEQELTGSFQLVRVQMPRASLGALRSPLELPNEIVEADVLLGEDGMARAIRLSTSGSVYPWRPR